jgi:hypothetical protein
MVTVAFMAMLAMGWNLLMISKNQSEVSREDVTVESVLEIEDDVDIEKEMSQEKGLNEEMFVEETEETELLVEEIVSEPEKAINMEAISEESKEIMEEEPQEEREFKQSSDQTIVITVPDTSQKTNTETVSMPEPQTQNVHICRFEKVETKASCLVEGKVEEKCMSCGTIKSQQIIDAKGHDFVKSVWEVATCLKSGYYNNVCQRCGLVEMTTENPLPHDVEDVVIQEGNCMEDRVLRHICRSCGLQVESDTRYVVQEHKWSKEMVDGIEVSVCKWCGVVQ